MAVFLSPGVFLNERDLSAFATLGSGVIAAFVGTAQKGPLNEARLITNAQQFIDTYGEPITDSYLGHAVLAFLEQGNSCWVNRVGVECEEGQDSALADVFIDTSGAQEEGWGRVALFAGVDYGRICTRAISSSNPLVFHTASTTTPTFVNIDEGSGDVSASLAISGAYADAVDDSFLVVITDAPTTDPLDGATYQVIRNSDGVVISSGTLTDSGGGVSAAFNIGSGDDDSGLDGTITVTEGVLGSGDYFVFSAEPDNTLLAFAVEGDPFPAAYNIPSASYSTAADFVTAFNSLAGSGEDYFAVEQEDGSVCIQTDTVGNWIQLVTSEAFALEIGVQKWAYDIPRSYILGTDSGPYNINTNNNRVKLAVERDGNTSITTEVTVTTNSAHTADSLSAELDVAGVISGTRYFDAMALQVSDTASVPLAITTSNNNTDNISLVANSSNQKTLRFAQELGIGFPYGNDYSPFDDSRVILPEQDVTDPSTPLSGSTADIAYYAAIVGFIVAESPGTWSDGYSIELQIYNGVSGRYTVFIKDEQNIVVDRIDDVSFDQTDDRYIGNIINEGSSLGGTNGNSWIRWEARPSDLANDPDAIDYEVRSPGTGTKEFSGGANGIPTDATYSSEVDAVTIGNASDNSGIHIFQNSEIFNIDLLVTPGVSSGSVIGQALTICEGRGDCVYLVDSPFGLRPQQVVDWHNGILDSSVTSAINSSYGALYWSWQKVFDQFSRNELFIPPSGHVSGVFARTARVGEKWFAPAGLNRGRLLTSLDVEYNPSVGERDLLYGFGNAVNPIVKFPQDGIVVFGQRTLQRANTALNRVNVRMLLNTIKKSLVSVLRNFLFEPNDRFLWSQVSTAVEPLLRDVAARRGLTGYKVVVDETNNTPERIDRNELWVTVYVKPTKAAEFIVLNLVVLRSDQSFSAEEALVAGGVVLTQ